MFQEIKEYLVVGWDHVGNCNLIEFISATSPEQAVHKVWLKTVNIHVSIFKVL